MRSFIATVAVAVASLVAVPAFAAPATEGAPAKAQRAEGGDKKHFPMPAAEFKAKVDARMTKARARMEEKAKSMNADQAKELRARFDATAAKVNVEVAKAVADGTVTADEAKAVRAANPHHGKHAKNRGQKGQKRAK